MAEGMIYDLLTQLASVIARVTLQEIRLVTGVKKAVKNLEDNLETVKTVLNDAEKKQFKDEAVKLWLQKLGDACYEMDDVVDEWNTAMIKSEIQEQQQQDNDATAVDNAPLVLRRKVCPFIPSASCCFRQVGKVVMSHDIAHKIKELNEKLDKITKERERYGFELTRGSSSMERPITTFLVEESKILGRDKVRNDLVSSLLDEGTISDKAERNPHVISLVGMGGIGKTTLAQLVYNHPSVQAHFSKRIWVCVSEPFDQCRVANEIIEAFDGGQSNINGFPNLMAKICELIQQSNKVLLVFDDVWTEESNLWDPFKIALQKGALGSRILVTTRNSRVAEIMESVRTINLEILSNNDCWSIFSKIAFLGRGSEQCKKLEDLARQISNKCKGLPLAAKTLGSLMRFKRSREQWEMVLSSNLWEFENVERGLFASLLLSYYDLPSPLKQCFSYCALFPKDFVFFSDELVLMWMAQGYIDKKENMEMVAREYFENLAIRSFFQDFEKNEDGDRIVRCKMHDIVHDFAQLLTKNECFIVSSDKMQGSNYNNARHLQLKIPEEAQFPESIYGANNLRTLIFEFQGDYNLSTLFQHFGYLRALTLNRENQIMVNENFKELPNAVENLIHLRYLNLVNYSGDALPETICNLCNLQILNIVLDGCKLQKLPQGMSKLINLRHFKLGFKLDFCFNVKFPRGFGRLTSLRTLSNFIVSGEDDSERCKLGALRNLNHLQGTLRINGLGSGVDECEAMNAQLKEKINLRNLILMFVEWGGDGKEIIREQDGEEIIREQDALVLNALEPPPNLESLRIVRYKASIMSPNWMMFLTNLKNLEISDASSLECLPPLGKLPFLKSLTMWINRRLKKLGVEFMGIEESEKKEKGDRIIPLFPNLISLKFWGFIYLEEWNGIEEEEDCIRRFTIMPRLQNLRIHWSQELKSLPNFLRTTPLQTLHIEGCPILEEHCKRGTGKEWPKISHIPNIWIDGIYVQRDGREYEAEVEAEPKMAHVKWSSSLDSIEVPVPIEMSVTPNPYVYEFVYRVGCKIQEYDEEFDEDDDIKEESNEDEVDEEEDDKALHDEKEDDEAEHL